MSFNIKKTLVDPLSSKKIKVPSSKNILLLQGNETYDIFNKTVEKQKDATIGSVWKIITPIAVGIVGLGIAAYEYIAMRIENEQCYDEAELLINEAAADNKITTKENEQ